MRIALVALLLALQPAAAQLRGFDAYVAQAVRDWNVPGLAIAVVKDDSVMFLKGYGVRALGSTDTVGPHTLFANASTTKAFTALAVALMVDDGKLQWYGRTFDYAAMLRRLRYVNPESSLRSRFADNNVAYATAGVIVGRVAGTSWDEVVKTRILTPLGMTETVTQARDLASRGDVAAPHDYIGDTLRLIGRDAVDLVDPIAPAGSMYSTVTDMAKWLRFLLDSGRVAGRRLVTAASFAELFRPQVVIGPQDGFYPTARLTRPHFTAYGLGWFLEDYRGEFVAFHTGSIDGTVAIVGLVPERRLGVVIFANRDHAELRHALMYRVFDAYLGGPPRDWSKELRAMYDSLRNQSRQARHQAGAARVMGTAPSLPLDRYAGTYTDSLYGDLTLRLEGGALVAEVSPFLVADVEHWHYDVFRLRWRNRWVPPDFATFHVGPDGKVAEVDLAGLVLKNANP